MPSLIVFKDGQLQRTVPLDVPSVILGRKSDCDVRLEHETIGRRHARVFNLEGRYHVLDEGSTNGVLVNGQKVKKGVLAHGDKLEMGPFSIWFDDSAPASQAPAANAELNREREAYESLQALFRVSSEFSTLVNLPELLEKMIDNLISLFQADRGLILLARGGKLEPVVSRRIEAGNLSSVISSSVARRVAESRQPTLVNDVRDADGFQTSESIQAAEIRSIVCAPLLAGDHAIGVVYLDSQMRRRRFEDRDLELLGTFSRHAVGLITSAAEKDRLRKDVHNLTQLQKSQQAESGDFSGIIGGSPAISKVLRQARQVAMQDVTTLILGQSGTGKELLARAIHESSRRKDKPFVAVNCMALSRDVVESELFGHEKGAFTGAADRRVGRFELADGGTLFLDEIGELSKDIQVKLLRVLQERKIERVGSSQPIDIDVRLLAATNQHLEEMVKEGTFREDLYYRINVIALYLPRLSERREDVPHLVNHFVQHFNRQLGIGVTGVDPEAMRALTSYSWPGNIRELRNVIERAFVLETTDRITLESLPFNLLKAFENQDSDVTSLSDEPAEGGDFGKAKHQFEKSFILEALRRNKGNVSSTAQDIGLPRKTLYRKMELLQIDLAELHEAHDLDEKQKILDCLKKHGGNISAVSTELGIPRTSVYRKLTSYGVDAKEFS